MIRCLGLMPNYEEWHCNNRNSLSNIYVWPRPFNFFWPHLSIVIIIWVSQIWVTSNPYLKIKSSSQLSVFLDVVHLCFQPKNLGITLNTHHSQTFVEHLLWARSHAKCWRHGISFQGSLFLVIELSCYLVYRQAYFNIVSVVL